MLRHFRTEMHFRSRYSFMFDIRKGLAGSFLLYK